MTLVRWEPASDFLTLRDAMGKLFEESFVRPTAWFADTPEKMTFSMDMFENPTEIVVKAVLPGIKAEEITISLIGDLLTIEAEMKPVEEEHKDTRWHYQERRYGMISRAITLPVFVKPDKIDAVFENGILTLTLPKIEEVKPKTIKVKAK